MAKNKIKPRLFKLIFCLFFMCAMCQSNSINIVDKGRLMNQITYEKKVFDIFPFAFYDISGNVKDFSIDDKLAFEIGIAILAKAYGKDKIFGYRYFVSESTREGVFVITAIPVVDTEYIILGGSYNVALSKEDGKILRIWQE